MLRFHRSHRGSNPLGVAIFGRLAQLVERYPYKVDVTSSSLVATTIKRTRNEQSSSSATLTLGFLQQKAHKTSFVLGKRFTFKVTLI